VRDTQRALVATLVAAACWGLSGTMAQALFERFEFPILGLGAVRMLGAGAILLLFVGPRGRPPLTLSFVSFAVLGVAATQLTFLEAVQLSNAVTATLLQYLFLPMVAGYEALRGRVAWSARWTATLVVAGAGTVLLVAGVNARSLGVVVTPLGLVFGLGAAVAGAYYSLAGARLVHEHGPWSVSSWGFLVGGVVTLPFGAASFIGYAPPSGVAPWVELVGLLVVIVLIGTVVAYGLYLYGLRYLPATEVGVVSSLEPIASAVATYAFLGVVLTGVQYAGGALIVLAVALLGLHPPAPPAHGPRAPEPSVGNGPYL